MDNYDKIKSWIPSDWEDNDECIFASLFEILGDVDDLDDELISNTAVALGICD